MHNLHAGSNPAVSLMASAEGEQDIARYSSLQATQQRRVLAPGLVGAASGGRAG